MQKPPRGKQGPEDANEIAVRVAEQATGEAPQAAAPEPTSKQIRARAGGTEGGPARAAELSSGGVVESNLSTGYVFDAITGQPVRATPEEVEAVQVFAHRLVDDYGYPTTRIQTHPQFRVRKRPSDEQRSYPVDIAVFAGDARSEANLFMVVECKKKKRKDGEAQLKLYMDMSPAVLGVWFNGQSHLYLRKVLHPDGTRTYHELPNIPRYGQRIEDIGLFRRRELQTPSNLRAVFKDLRYHLAGNLTGITRDETLAQEIINLLFCKIYDEVHTGVDEVVTFRSGVGEEADGVLRRVQGLFDRVRSEYDDVFSPDEAIRLDAESVNYVVGELQNYSLTDADRDAVGDAFEVFIGPALRGPEGQFFTPRNLIQTMVQIVDPEPGEMIIDPACGSGGFLIAALEHVWRKIERRGAELGWSAVAVEREKLKVARKHFRGIEKDSFLAKVTKAYMAIVGDGRGGVFCENSLEPPVEWAAQAQQSVPLGTFDVVLTNPPFGARIPVRGSDLLGQYELGHKWAPRTGKGSFVVKSALKEVEAPQILFIERCLQLLKPGGRMAIVLPEGIFGNRGTGYILDVIRAHGRILAIIDCTRRLFQPSTDTKTNVLIFQRYAAGEPARSKPIFFSVVKSCGHNKRGTPTYLADGTPDDEFPKVAPLYATRESAAPSHLGFNVQPEVLQPYYLVPRYYDPEVQQTLDALKGSGRFSLMSIGELQRARLLCVLKAGHEIGSDAYGSGDIPFIRTSDIANFEITWDPTFAVGEDVYARYAAKQGLRTGDILFVNDGRYRIGNVAILTKHDTRILIQSHFRVLRVLQSGALDPFMLLYLLKHPAVRLQVQAKTFIQSTIATISNRLLEVVLPIPNAPSPIHERVESLRSIITERARLRLEAKMLDIYEED